MATVTKTKNMNNSFGVPGGSSIFPFIGVSLGFEWISFLLNVSP